MDKKVCTGYCGLEKDITEFYNRQAKCKDCNLKKGEIHIVTFNFDNKYGISKQPNRHLYLKSNFSIISKIDCNAIDNLLLEFDKI